MKAKLTTRNVSSFKPRSKYYKVWDTEHKNYFLRVMPSGVKTYCIYYRHDGVAREYTIGKYGSITADRARQLAKIKLGEAAGGEDIQTLKKAARAQSHKRKCETLGGFIENKYKDWVLASRKTGHEIITGLKRDFEYLFTRNMSEISSWDIQKWRTEKTKQELEKLKEMQNS